MYIYMYAYTLKSHFASAPRRESRIHYIKTPLAYMYMLSIGVTDHYFYLVMTEVSDQTVGTFAQYY